MPRRPGLLESIFESPLLRRLCGEPAAGSGSDERRTKRSTADGRLRITELDATGVEVQTCEVRLLDVSAAGLAFTHHHAFAPGQLLVASAGGEARTLLLRVKNCQKAQPAGYRIGALIEQANAAAA